MRTAHSIRLAGLVALATIGCGGGAHDTELAVASSRTIEGVALEVRQTVTTESFDAPGTAQPFQEAVLSTRLMGTVREVLVREGSRVGSGAVLLRLDAAELDAKAAQVAAQVGGAEAMLSEAERQAARIRALYADSAATRAQLDAAQTGVAGARAALEAARAGGAELAAVRSYATLRAPFAGFITSRRVDPGALAAPGAPLLVIQDAERLRIGVQVPTEVARLVGQGDTLTVTIGGATLVGRVEGVVPAPTGNLAIVNVVVGNPGTRVLPGSAATVAIPIGERSVLLVPAAAVVREGDLTGVRVRTADGDLLRWIRVGASHGEMVEVLGGLTAGTTIVVPSPPAGED
jgi:RND family efflux transporter MFP subunit